MWSNEVGHSRHEASKRVHQLLTISKLQSAAPVQSQLNEAGTERVTHEDSWKEQSMFLRVMLWWGITGTPPLQPKPTKSLTETAEQRREGADMYSRTPNTRNHSYSGPVYSFRWVTLFSLSVCLAISFSLCLSLSWLLTLPEANQKTADVCTNKMTPGLVCSWTSKKKNHTKLQEWNNGDNWRGMSCLENC